MGYGWVGLNRGDYKKWSLPNIKRPGRWIHSKDGIYGYDVIRICWRTEDLLFNLGDRIYLVEYTEPSRIFSRAMIVSSARLLKKIEEWNPRTSKEFFTKCILHAGFTDIPADTYWNPTYWTHMLHGLWRNLPENKDGEYPEPSLFMRELDWQTKELHKLLTASLKV